MIEKRNGGIDLIELAYMLPLLLTHKQQIYTNRNRTDVAERQTCIPIETAIQQTYHGANVPIPFTLHALQINSFRSFVVVVVVLPELQTLWCGIFYAIQHDSRTSNNRTIAAN